MTTLSVLVEPKATRVMRAGYWRPGCAATVKRAFWPWRTWPTSASSTSTESFIFVRSSASVNSVTACSDAATALPGSTLRASTVPSIGERIEDFARLVSLVDSVVWTWRTLASADARSASARAALARAVSSSAADGTLPPDSRATSS